jgi:hypothetical protein
MMRGAADAVMDVRSMASISTTVPFTELFMGVPSGRFRWFDRTYGERFKGNLWFENIALRIVSYHPGAYPADPGASEHA